MIIIFDIINEERKAYWLGFLAADGYIIKGKNGAQDHVGITLKQEDKYILEEFKKDLESNSPINRKETRLNGKIFYSNSFEFKSQQMSDRLADFGIVARKSLILQYPTNIPKEYEKDFVRGYVDGDGSVGINARKEYWFQINGTYDFLMGIQNFFNTSQKLIKRKNIYVLSYYGNHKVPNLLQQIYGEATIFLKRKYQKYAEMQGINCAMDTQVQQF